MVVVGTTTGDRTYLQSVQRLLMEIGEQKVVTLAQPTVRVENAMNAVEAARDEVWYDTMWPFRRGHFEVELVASQMWYELPEDYHKLASFVSRNNRDFAIDYVTYDKLLEVYPELRLFPPGSGIGSTISVLQAVQQTTNFGTPLLCADWSGYIALMPVPDADFVALERTLYAHYWRHAPALSGDGDYLGLPRNLWDACHHLALSRFKKVLEYSDWEADRLVGQRMLAKAAASKGESKNSDIYYNGGLNYNE